MKKVSLRIAPLYAFNEGLLFLLKIFARILAILPESWVALLCRCLGLLARLFLRGRTRTTLHSLAHAFPGEAEVWRRKVLRDSTARLFEMGLFRLASAYFSRKRSAECLEIPPEAAELIATYAEGGSRHGKPVVILLPHMTMAEAATLLPGLIEGIPKVHVLFRPLNQPAIDRWVTAEREKCGASMVSRKRGYNDAMSALRRGEMVAVLFDQDASNKGSTITFMDRIVSATDLPALMAHRFDADVLLMLTERQCFWRARLRLTQIPLGESPTEVTIRAHDILESYLRQSQDTAADWLWFHDRWDHFFTPNKRFRLPEKRNHIDLANRLHRQEGLARKVRFFVRLPNWLGDVVMAYPVLSAIRKARPDFEFTLIGKAAFEPMVQRFGLADCFIALPAQGAAYYSFFLGLRNRYPDTCLLLTNSFRGDFEAFLTGSLQRFGMKRPGKRRPFLTKAFPLPETLDETKHHQTNVWGRMARFYGLREALDFSPIANPEIERSGSRVGLICGTENSPQKRWPVDSWRTLIDGLLQRFPQLRVELFGTENDREITDAVRAGFDEDRVVDRAGRTNLAEFCDALESCAVVCCNDTGGMHLANMLGTPVVAVFGPTNPVRTGPVFDAPKVILQPEGCPATGGMPIDRVVPERVIDAVLSFVSGGQRD